jgi:Flp pilus assembly protein TadD
MNARRWRFSVERWHNLITSALRNLAIIVSYDGREVEGLALMDSAIVRNRAENHDDAAAYIVAQRVPMLVRLGRIDEALRSAKIGFESRARLPRGSTYHADLTYWLGLATLAAGRAEEAVGYLTQAHEMIRTFYPQGHPRLGMTECARGIALARIGHDDEARAHMAAGCPELARWGLADPTIVRWARELAK